MKKFILIFSACMLIIIASVFVRQYVISSFYKRHLISETINVPLVFRGDAGDLDISQWKGKYVVLYFLDSTSGKESKDGHKKFRKICDSRIKSDERVKIASVRCNPSGTVETASREADDIHVPILSLNENNLLDQLKINELPTVLIIGPEWEVNFRGSSLDAAYKCILALTYAIGEG